MPVYASTQSLPSVNLGLKDSQERGQARRLDLDAHIAADPAPTPLLVQPPKFLRGVLSAKNTDNKSVLARQRPGVDSVIVGSIKPGRAQEIVGRSVDGQWWLIALDGDATGWVTAAMLQTQGILAHRQDHETTRDRETP